MSLFNNNILAGASGAGGAEETLYVDDVFSTYLYDGNGSTQTIVNELDLDGEGGLVWFKRRDGTNDHVLYDTERGATKRISTNSTGQESTLSNGLTAFNSDGFSLGSHATSNSNGNEYVSWSFRKAPGFFDVVTWTGDGTGERDIAHSLGSTPGCVILKKTSTTDGWYFQHRSLTNGFSSWLTLHTTSTENATGSQVAVSSTELTLGSYYNASNTTYVAYIFAHDDQSFGTNSDEAIIKCGSYTGNGSSDGPEIDLGFEPQWVLVKNAGLATNWFMFDTQRAMTFDGVDGSLKPNANTAEATSLSFMGPRSSGFKLTYSGTDVNQSGGTYVYIAIRRPHKPPTAGTEVFTADAAGTNTGTTNSLIFEANHVVDLCLHKHRTASTASTFVFDRLRGVGKRLFSNNNIKEAGTTQFGFFDFQEGVGSGSSAGNGSDHCAWMFRRAPGFLDVVAYTGNGTAGRTVEHNLGVTPEMIWVKRRDSAQIWICYHQALGNTHYVQLNDSAAPTDGVGAWNDTDPTSSVFSVGTGSGVNGTNATYVAYLFATLSGISKVGSYSGTGSDVNVDCGFTAGARYVLIKRTDSTGDWYHWDTSRGIVAGNDPYLLLNETNAEVTSTDYIDPLSSGFTVTSSAPAALNASGGTYIFLAIA